jgi:hypothetical protein
MTNYLWFWNCSVQSHTHTECRLRVTLSGLCDLRSLHSHYPWLPCRATPRRTGVACNQHVTASLATPKLAATCLASRPASPRRRPATRDLTAKPRPRLAFLATNMHWRRSRVSPLLQAFNLVGNQQPAASPRHPDLAGDIWTCLCAVPRRPHLASCGKPALCEHQFRPTYSSCREARIRDLQFAHSQEHGPLLQWQPRPFSPETSQARVASFDLRRSLCCRPRTSSQRIHRPPVTGYPSLWGGLQNEHRVGGWKKRVLLNGTKTMPF